MLVWKQNGAKQKMAESFWMVRAHGVSEARVHGVSRARVHGVCWERKKSSGSVGIFQGKAIFKGSEGGEAGRWVDPLAKLQIRGSKQPNLTRSNKLQEKFLGLFLWGFSNLDEKQQNQASKWGGWDSKM